MKQLVMNKYGKMTKCSMPPERRGRERCNHLRENQGISKDGSVYQKTKETEKMRKAKNKELDKKMETAIDSEAIYCYDQGNGAWGSEDLEAFEKYFNNVDKGLYNELLNNPTSFSKQKELSAQSDAIVLEQTLEGGSIAYYKGQEVFWVDRDPENYYAFDGVYSIKGKELSEMQDYELEDNANEVMKLVKEKKMICVGSVV